MGMGMSFGIGIGIGVWRWETVCRKVGKPKWGHPVTSRGKKSLAGAGRLAWDLGLAWFVTRYEECTPCFPPSSPSGVDYSGTSEMVLLSSSNIYKFALLILIDIDMETFKTRR